MVKPALLAFWFFVAAFARATIPIGPDTFLAPYLVNISLDVKNVPFYGNAFLIAKDDSKVFFVTNFHILPSEQYFSRLRITGPITNNEPLPIKIIGYAPGKDLAVFSAEQDGQVMNSAEFKRDFKVDFHAQLPTAKDDVVWKLSQEKYHLGILGMNDGHGSFGFVWTDQSWQSELSNYQDWNAIVKSYRDADLSPDAPLDFSRKPILVTADLDCPPVFLRYCLRVPIRTQGFSGSILLGSQRAKPDYYREELKILGMVSHYSVYSGDTYVIPIDQVVATGQRLIAEGRAISFARPIWILKDDSETFEWIAPETVRLLKTGTMTEGTVIRQASLRSLEASPAGFSIGGGGPSIGGGGPSIGGGGPSIGGGGPSIGGGGPRTGGAFTTDFPDAAALRFGWLISDIEAAGAGFFDFDQVRREAKLPEHWGDYPMQLLRLLGGNHYLRGSQAFASQVPGALVGNTGTKILEWEGNDITTLQNFVNSYVYHGARNFPGYHFASKPELPSALSLRSDSLGALYPVTVQKLSETKVQTLIGKVRQATILEKVLFQTKQSAAAEGVLLPDMVAARSPFFPIQGISQAVFSRGDSLCRLELSNAAWGKGTVEFPSRLLAEGAGKFLYQGEVKVSGFLPLRFLPETKFYGLISFNRELSHPTVGVRFLLIAEFETRPTTPAIGTDLWLRLPNDGPWLFVLASYLPMAEILSGDIADYTTESLEAGARFFFEEQRNPQRQKEVLHILDQQEKLINRR